MADPLYLLLPTTFYRFSQLLLVPAGLRSIHSTLHPSTILASTAQICNASNRPKPYTILDFTTGGNNKRVPLQKRPQTDGRNPNSDVLSSLGFPQLGAENCQPHRALSSRNQSSKAAAAVGRDSENLKIDLADDWLTDEPAEESVD